MITEFKNIPLFHLQAKKKWHNKIHLSSRSVWKKRRSNTGWKVMKMPPSIMTISNIPSWKGHRWDEERMHPYEAVPGILALVGYFVLWVMMYTYISETHDTIYAGIIAVLVYGWLLHKKQILHLSSRDLKGSQLLFCVGIGLVCLFFPNLFAPIGGNPFNPGANFGIMVCLLMVFLEIPINYLSTKMFLQKHDALPA